MSAQPPHSDDDVVGAAARFLKTHRPEGKELRVVIYADGVRILDTRRYVSIFPGTPPAPPASDTPPPPPEVPDRLRTIELDIIGVIENAGHRLTTSEILSALDRAGKLHGEGTVIKALAKMRRDEIITNVEPKHKDSHGHGYGLADW